MQTEQVSLAMKLASMPKRDREMFYLSLSPDDAYTMQWDWNFWARPNQLEPAGENWSTWLALAGRGFGKTKLGAEWVRANMCGDTPLAPGRARRVALIAETAADARDVMVQGPSGILAVHPPEFRPRYVKSDRALYWPNGAIGLLFSAEEPDQLRGPEHDLAWSDELAKWRYAQETWDMLQFGLRIGLNPRQLVTTTPRPIPIVRELLKGRESGDVVVTLGSTYDNSSNLSPKFIHKMKQRYEGTRLGRQELMAELLDDVPGALWTRMMLDKRSAQNPKGAGMDFREKLPDMQRVVIGVDPSGTSGEEDDNGDDVGIVAAGKGVDGNYYVLQDATVALGPAGWARHVKDTFNRNMADLIVGEVNYGGAMVEYTIRSVDRKLPYKNVNASRGKVVRAQPVASLYEQGRVRHVGALAALEDQMCSMTGEGFLGIGSPDRVDAAVWALTELAFGTATTAGSKAIGGHH